MKIAIILSVVAALTFGNAAAVPVDHLQACYQKQVKPLGEQSLMLSFSEQKHQLYHSFEPWMNFRSAAQGTVWVNGAGFAMLDSLVKPKKTYYAKTQLDHDIMMSMGYGDTALNHISISEYMNAPLMTARYNPAYLLEYIVRHRLKESAESNSEFAKYTLTINKSIVTLSIRKSDDLVDNISTIENHNLYGDLNTKYIYSGYQRVKDIDYPSFIEIVELGGKVRDSVEISSAIVKTDMPTLLTAPKNYRLDEDVLPKPTQISTEQYNKYIHFVNVQPANMKSMIVEFKDYLLVAEAPLTSANGELIIEEARKIAPTKPIKYFVFGHFHHHYLGGVRPFVHKNATILAQEIDQEYLQFIVNAPRTIEPDSLQLQPQTLHTATIKDSMTISDGNVEMKLYVIGKKSEHAKDFLVYYFPKEHLLFEDELTWINEEPPIKKAGERQAGLYNAIKDLGINVETIIRSWPITGYKLKSVIPFSDLEESMKVK